MSAPMMKTVRSVEANLFDGYGERVRRESEERE
jgi:hypothetical protein